MQEGRTDSTGNILLHDTLLCATGLAVNLIFSNIALFFKLPLFLDNIGNIMVAAVGGALPGMLTGFLTNTVNAVHNQVTLYYGVLSILIAYSASILSRRGMLKTWLCCICAVLCFTVIGGALGSCMTWMLYGGSIGEGISAPFAQYLAGCGFPLFWAQFTADICIDGIDKTITVAAVYVILSHYPAKLYGMFQMSYLYDRSPEETKKYGDIIKKQYSRISLNSRIISLIVCAVILVSLLSTGLGIQYYNDRLKDQYSEKVMTSAKLAASYIDPEKIDSYIAQGRKAPGYKETEENLYRIYHNMQNLLFVYVYRFTPQGTCVVFDLTVPSGPSDPPGALIQFDTTLGKYRGDFLAGKDFSTALLSNDQYGWVCTGVCPIRDLRGTTQAYACVDIALNHFRQDMLMYIIRILAVLFGLTIMIAAFTLWYAQLKIVTPINCIVRQADAFYRIGAEHWLDSHEWNNRTRIHTGDEIEELYNTICTGEINLVQSVEHIKETEWKLHRSKEIEQKNRELAAAVKQADDANAAKTLFLSNISHDMRTPLNSVIGFTGLAKETGSAREKDRYLEKIGQSAEYLLALINDTLDLSRIETGKLKFTPKVFNGEKLTSSVINCNQAAADKKHIHLAVHDEILHGIFLYADEMRLEEIFNNIIGNSIKFTPDGGTITVITEKTAEDEKSISIRFILSDNGIGMSREFLPHIFEPFSQEDPYKNKNFTGSGLGLSIVKSIVEMMGGTITAASEQGKGTVMTVCLTIQKAVRPAENGSVHADISILNGRRILLCEDHPMNIELAVLLLEKQGMTVKSAMNGQEGVKMFTASAPGSFDAILMDIRMPVMDGLEAARRIRDSDHTDAKTVPIIAMTANAYEEDRENTRKAGMNAHLAKPINPEELYRTLAEEIAKTADSTQNRE